MLLTDNIQSGGSCSVNYYQLIKFSATKPVTYSIVDLMGEAVKGSFYEQELQKAKQQTFRIEKVIRRDNKKKLALVKWSAYPDKFNSQVSFKDLVDF